MEMCLAKLDLELQALDCSCLPARAILDAVTLFFPEI